MKSLNVDGNKTIILVYEGRVLQLYSHMIINIGDLI